MALLNRSGQPVVIAYFHKVRGVDGPFHGDFVEPGSAMLFDNKLLGTSGGYHSIRITSIKGKVLQYLNHPHQTQFVYIVEQGAKGFAVCYSPKKDIIAYIQSWWQHFSEQDVMDWLQLVDNQSQLPGPNLQLSKITESSKFVGACPGVCLSEGVYCLYEPQGPPEFDVVFLHGLTPTLGGEDQWYSAWFTQQGDASPLCWPKDWLPELFPNARVLSFSYDSNPSHWSASPYETWADIDSKDILVGSKLGSRPFFLVGCNAGGLLLKQVLLRHKEVAFANCRGMVFLGVPCTQDLAIMLHRMFEVSVRGLNTLRPLSGELLKLVDAWLDLSASFGPLISSIPSLHFMETGAQLGSTSGPVIVDGGIKELVFVDGEHLDLSKPSSRTDPRFFRTVCFLMKWLCKDSFLARQGWKDTVAFRRGIPQQLFTLTSIDGLDFSFMNLTDFIPPAALKYLTALRYLDLSNNDFEGSIPPSVSTLISLKGISFSYNRLTGGIPPHLLTLSLLRELHLHNNKLRGPVPSGLSALLFLQRLDLSCNELVGPIPSQLSALSSLQMLHLHNNKLSGAIPSGLSALLFLQRLNLSNNELVGPIPSQLSALSSLQRLHLSNNQLQGPVPHELSALSSLTMMDFGGNQFSDILPAVSTVSSPKILDIKGSSKNETHDYVLASGTIG